MYQVKICDTQNVLENIIELRYIILRKPWNKPKDTVTDDLETSSINAYIQINNMVVACGRLQDNSKGIAQIRYMAVDTNYQAKGLGKLIINKLEEEALKNRIKVIELHARENAVEFYKASGYSIKEKSIFLWDLIQHYLMIKEIAH